MWASPSDAVAQDGGTPRWGDSGRHSRRRVSVKTVDCPGNISSDGPARVVSEYNIILYAAHPPPPSAGWVGGKDPGEVITARSEGSGECSGRGRGGGGTGEVGGKPAGLAGGQAVGWRRKGRG